MNSSYNSSASGCALEACFKFFLPILRFLLPSLKKKTMTLTTPEPPCHALPQRVTLSLGTKKTTCNVCSWGTVLDDRPKAAACTETNTADTEAGGLAGHPCPGTLSCLHLTICQMETWRALTS